MLVSFAEVCGGGRGGYGKTLRGLAWYIGWPFGKYVEGEGAPEDSDHESDTSTTPPVDTESGYGGLADSPTRHRRRREASDGAASNLTIRQNQPPKTKSTDHDLETGLPDEPRVRREPTVSFAATPGGTGHPKQPSYDEDERAPLLGTGKKGFRRPRNKKAKLLGRIVYWPLFFLVLAPIMLFICTVCWFCVFTIPMAKLHWALLHLLYSRPLEINFRAAPKTLVPVPAVPSPAQDDAGDEEGSGSTTLNETSPSGGVRYQTAQLKAGQVAPTSGPTSTVLLCTYRAVGPQYYKYTVGGVNILFINLLPLVFFTIFDAFVLLPAVERGEAAGRHPSPFLAAIANQALIFVLSLASVIPLSYFIGMAVASISAQSSIGMGAVINATFGSVIEIILYSIALTQGKGRLVEGSIVGSILAGVLLMPGASMCSGAFKRKEQKFNAKSAGVTSTMLIMAIIGTLTPTMFYQTYGTVSFLPRFGS
jgi:Ca2+:H+ antiporter